MSQIIKPVMLDETGQTSNQKLTELNGHMYDLAEAIAAVHSVNGMDGDVVIDSTNIPVNKRDPDSKTISEVLADEQSDVTDAMQQVQAAVARTPLSFSVVEIEDTDYTLIFTVGTP